MLISVRPNFFVRFGSVAWSNQEFGEVGYGFYKIRIGKFGSISSDRFGKFGSVEIWFVRDLVLYIGKFGKFDWVGLIRLGIFCSVSSVK